MPNSSRESWRGFKDGFAVPGRAIAELVTKILLSAVYIAVVGAVAVAMKMQHKTLLPDPQGHSYWQERNLKTPTQERARRQF